ncbi:MAG: family 10 glycosylhydrolase [Kiritimatiellales bacterium]|nr:family 10 glycosylhydrolase [Kiritimatiellota bacterium]MBL7012259.1 family 10 glycosylhydrolase [Kiritimatiellales bacterium]
MKTRPLLFLLLLLPVVLFAGARPPRQPEVRAIWVTRFDYKTPLDVSSIVVNCAKAGFTDIFFQVRGNGTAFYPSQVEPWAFELHGKDVANTGKDPGWDPLQMAAGWAKRYNIRLHAYINVLPGWRGKVDPPRAAGQLWTAHPDWFMVDSTGARMRPTSAWYSFLNPAHPAVRSHLSQIAAELARYDIAGLHLDYIRFPYDYKDVAREIYPRASSAEIMAHSTFSFDPVSRRAMGSSTSRKQWDAFRRNAVSQVVSDLRGVLKASRGPQAVLSASVMADFSAGYTQAFQDSSQWAKTGSVDWLVPMNYNASLYDERLINMKRVLGRRGAANQLVVGINCEGDAREIRRQIAAAREAGCRGFALFAYSHLFENHQPTSKATLLK